MGNEASVPAGTSSADTTCGTRVRPTTPAPQWLESTAIAAEASWTQINDAAGTDKPPARETSGAVDGDGNLFLIGGRDAKDEYADVRARRGGRVVQAGAGGAAAARAERPLGGGDARRPRRVRRALARARLPLRRPAAHGDRRGDARVEARRRERLPDAVRPRQAHRRRLRGGGRAAGADARLRRLRDAAAEGRGRRRRGRRREEGGREEGGRDGGREGGGRRRSRPARRPRRRRRRSSAEPKGPAVEMGWFDETFELSMGWADGYPQWRWTKLECGGGEAPSARAAHAACALPTAAAADGSTSDKMIVFGGRAAAGRVDDLWVLTVDASTVDEEDNAAAAWSQPACTGAWPCARSFHSPRRRCARRAAARSAPSSAGCRRPPSTPDELHLLDVGSWSWVRLAASAAAPAPSPRGCAVSPRRRARAPSSCTEGRRSGRARGRRPSTTTPTASTSAPRSRRSTAPRRPRPPPRGGAGRGGGGGGGGAGGEEGKDRRGPERDDVPAARRAAGGAGFAVDRLVDTEPRTAREHARTACYTVL